MEMFEKIENAKAVIYTNSGMFKQVDLYKYDGLLFAKNGAGFLGLNRDKSTSSMTVKWREIKGVKIKGTHRIEI